MLALLTSSEYCLASLAKSSGWAAAWPGPSRPIADRREINLAAPSRRDTSRSIAQLVGSDVQPRPRQPAQRQRRPDDVGGVLLHVDVPLLLQQRQPLIHRQAESLGHPLDFTIHVAPGDGDVLPLAFQHDQLPVDHALEHFLAVVEDALAPSSSAVICRPLTLATTCGIVLPLEIAGTTPAGPGRRPTPERQHSWPASCRRPTCQTRPAAPS